MPETKFLKQTHLGAAVEAAASPALDLGPALAEAVHALFQGRLLLGGELAIFAAAAPPAAPSRLRAVRRRRAIVQVRHLRR